MLADDKRKLLQQPCHVELYDEGKCPRVRGVCVLVSAGDSRYCCRTCGTAFSVLGQVQDIEVITPGDWHGKWPWENDT